MVKLLTKGSFKSTFSFFKQGKYLDEKTHAIFNKYGPKCVDALRKVTPKNTGLTADSWSYMVKDNGLYLYNNNSNNGVPIAIILNYGYATGTGGYVQGRNYINPTLRPLFDAIVDEINKEMQNL